jgi:uncharacterized protein YijF (DUF1287 family)
MGRRHRLWLCRDQNERAYEHTASYFLTARMPGKGYTLWKARCPGATFCLSKKIVRLCLTMRFRTSPYVVHRGRVWAPLHQGFFNDRREAIGLNLGKIFTGEGTRMKIHTPCITGVLRVLTNFSVRFVLQLGELRCGGLDRIRAVLREGIFPKKEAVRLGKDKPFIAFFLKNVKVGGGLGVFVMEKSRGSGMKKGGSPPKLSSVFFSKDSLYCLKFIKIEGLKMILRTLLFSLLCIRICSSTVLTYDGLAAAALKRAGASITYDGKYVSLNYPMGDVPDDTGVCTDVVIRSYRALGLDLQELVHEDMKLNFKSYPQIWGAKRANSSIDHRRVPNLRTFFKRHGASLVISKDPSDYKPGDLVTWNLRGSLGNLPHIGVVSSLKTPDGKHPLIVHNIGSGPKAEDILFDYQITGHYRYGLK